MRSDLDMLKIISNCCGCYKARPDPFPFAGSAIDRKLAQEADCAMAPGLAEISPVSGYQRRSGLQGNGMIERIEEVMPKFRRHVAGAPVGRHIGMDLELQDVEKVDYPWGKVRLQSSDNRNHLRHPVGWLQGTEFTPPDRK